MLTLDKFNDLTKSKFSRDEQRILWTWFSENLSKNSPWEIWISELLNDKPVQYIFGYAFFHKYKFEVNQNVLIPRPETEELCELIIKQNNPIKDIKCIEIGTGSGCITNTLALETENWKFDAIDISEDAISVAKRNANTYKIHPKINYKVVDFFSIQREENNYDIIVSNPPYIDQKEINNLAPTVINFEPHIALFVKENILEFYIGIFNFFKRNTKPNSQCWMECHQDYCDQVVELFNSEFRAKKIEDLSGNPRFVMVEKT